MAEIVNLHREKKRRARAEDAASAQQNRVRHGRTAAQKAADSLTARRLDAAAEGHRLERDDTEQGR